MVFQGGTVGEVTDLLWSQRLASDKVREVEQVSFLFHNTNRREFVGQFQFVSCFEYRTLKGLKLLLLYAANEF